MRANRRDLATSGLFLAIGLGYGAMSLSTLRIGQPLNMGPGSFPLILCGLIIIIGIAVGVRSFVVRDDAPFGDVPWRGIVMIAVAMGLFALIFRQVGILPGVFLTAFLACFASPQIGVLQALAIAAGIAAFSTLVFGFGIRLPVPIIGPFFNW